MDKRACQESSIHSLDQVLTGSDDRWEEETQTLE
jgi:hypothetical protein